MRAHNSQINFSDDRKKEHLRQQERLKAMAITSDEAHMISADLMIDNLLQSSFTKLPQMPAINQTDHLNLELPLWLQCESSAVPPQYKYLWSMVESLANLADTQKVSQLLLTSGLSVDVLGFIWNLANKAVPGKLTKQEFFIVLALVSLAQAGYKFNDLSVLKSITMPSPPVLHIDFQNCSSSENYPPQSHQTSRQNEFFNIPNFLPKHSMNLNENLTNEGHVVNNALNKTFLVDDFNKGFNAQKENDGSNSSLGNNSSKAIEDSLLMQNAGLSNLYFSGTGTKPELEDDFSAFQSGCTAKDMNDKSDKTSNVSANDSGDDFTEFQSANVEPSDPFQTVVINQKREIPKLLLPKTLTGKFSSLKTNMLKISPETEKKLKVLPPAESISSLPESKISSSNKVSTSISVLGSNHGIGSRLANHSLNTKLDRPKYHKHHKIKINPILPPDQNSSEEIIFGVKPRNLETVIPKCRPKYLNNCKSFTSKETKIKNDDILESSPSKHLEDESKSFTSHLGESTRQIEIPMLGTFNETILPTQSKSQTIDLIAVHEDKYSALREIELELCKDIDSNSKEVNDDFGDFLSAVIPEPLDKEEKKDCRDWNLNTEAPTEKPTFDLEPSKAKSVVNSTEAEFDLFDTFDLMTIKDDNQTLEPNLYSLEEQDSFRLSTEENIVNDLIIQSENINTVSKVDQALNLQSDKEFWELLSNDVKPLKQADFSRHGSVPSLDLKITAIDELEQETVWKKCLDSCLCIIQDGYKILNNINTKSILDEVFTSCKTEDYLNNLNIVFQISKRVSENFHHLPATQEELEKFWGRLQDLCFEYNIKLKQDENICSEGKVKCSICFKHIGCDIITQGTSSYHLSCANFWINCIERTLPFSI